MIDYLLLDNMYKRDIVLDVKVIDIVVCFGVLGLFVYFFL